MPNYVKFQRGSQAAYTSLLNSANKGEAFYDTLYFIYDSNNKAAGGTLYLGDILIGGAGQVGATTLASLSDIDLTDLAAGSFLQYNNISQKWEAVDPDDFSFSSNVKIGTLGENETVAQAQARLLPSPNEGDIVIIDGEPYIYAGSSSGWTPLTSEDLSSKVTTLATRVSTLENRMNNVNHLTYSVVGSLNDIDTAILNPTADLNRTIFLVPSSSGVLNDSYDEYMVVNQNDTIVKERLGSVTAPDMSNYVTTTQLNTAIGNLETSIANTYVSQSSFNTTIGSLQDDITDIEADIVVIKDSLEWKAISGS